MTLPARLSSYVHITIPVNLYSYLLAHMGDFLEQIEAKDANLVILSMGNERVDTSTAIGKLILNLMLAIVSLTAPLETIPIHLALPV